MDKTSTNLPGRQLKGLPMKWYQVLSALLNALESKDPAGAGHGHRVATHATQLALAIGLPRAEVDLLEIGVLLHDIGKVSVSDTILQKPGPLTEAEFQIVQSHPTVGARILRPAFTQLEPRILEVVLYHHERIDGAGYPRGLVGEAIPLWARICCITDAWDAMTSPRPYRAPLSVGQAVTELRRCSGTHFDKDLVNCFIDTVLPGLGGQE